MMTDSTSGADSKPLPAGPNPLLALWKGMTSFRTAVVLLALCMLLVLGGTFAQVHEGLYLAQERWFKGWFIFLFDCSSFNFGSFGCICFSIGGFSCRLCDNGRPFILHLPFAS